MLKSIESVAGVVIPSGMKMSKYNIPDNHEWQDEQEAKEQQQAWENLASLKEHTVTVLYDKEQEYQTAEKYECLISHSDHLDKPKVLRVATFQNKGNFWRRKDIDDWIDFQDMPMPARKVVADTVGMTVQELTHEERLVDNDE